MTLKMKDLDCRPAEPRTANTCDQEGEEPTRHIVALGYQPWFQPIEMGIAITFRESDLAGVCRDDLNVLSRVFDEALIQLLDAASCSRIVGQFGAFFASASLIAGQAARKAS